MSSPGYFFTPEDQAQEDALKRRQAFARALIQSGTNDPGDTPYAGLRSAGNSLIGAFLSNKADSSERDLARSASDRYNTDMASFLKGGATYAGGAVPAPQISNAGGPDMPVDSSQGQQQPPTGAPMGMGGQTPMPQQTAQASPMDRLLGTHNPALIQQFAPQLFTHQLGREDKVWENSQPLSVAEQQKSQLDLDRTEALEKFKNGLPLNEKDRASLAIQQGHLGIARAHLGETQRHNKAEEFSASHPFGADVPLGPDGQAATGDNFLAGISKTNPGLANQVKAIAQYRQAPPGRGTKQGIALLNLVNQYAPTYDATTFPTKQKARNDYGTGVQGKSVVAINNAMAHLDLLGQLSDALGNGDIQLINRARQAYEQQTGSPAPTTFDAVRNIAAQEVVKSVVPGGGGVAERAAAAEDFKKAASPQQIRGAINGVKGLFSGQLGNYRQQYHKLTGLDDFDEFLSPETKSLSHMPVAQAVNGGGATKSRFKIEEVH